MSYVNISIASIFRFRSYYFNVWTS